MGRKKKNRIGETNINNQGLKMTIIKYRIADDITIQFEDGTIKSTKYWCFKTGAVLHPNYKIFRQRNEDFKIQRIGKTKKNYQGCEMKIIKYKNAHDITIQFLDSYKTEINSNWINFKRGSIKNPMFPSVCGVGIVGTKIPITENHHKTKEYQTWVGMIRRCYNPHKTSKAESYKDCFVAEDWLYYPNFYKWLISQSNYKKWKNGTTWELDKDILYKGNRIYSKNTCCLVPSYINQIFKSSKENRGLLPIGVSIDKNGNYFAQCINSITNTNKYLGNFDTPESAFEAYKQFKEKLIQEIATIEYQKENISKECYQGMMNYRVEITD